jgi:carbonic anhydrase
MTPFPQRLIDGYHAFLSDRLPTEQTRFRELAERGQSPEIMVIGCCDSRVSPEVIFDARPGELFVVRNVANLVPPYVPDHGYHGDSAALEFAVAALEVKHIVVLGHAHCGGVRACAEGAPPLSSSDFIGRWMELMAPAVARAGPRGSEPFADYLTRLEQASIANSLDNLKTFSWLDTLVAARTITLHGAWFGVATGQLFVRDPATGAFAQVAAAAHARVIARPRF